MDSSEGTESPDDGVAVKPTDDGWEPTNDGSNGSSGNTSTPDPIPEKPDPILPTEPDEEEEGIPGMILYHDCGSFELCAAVIDGLSEKIVFNWIDSICV